MEPATNKAFVSHQDADKEFTEGLAKHLRLNGVDVFFDKWDIKGGDSIPEEIEGGLLKCNIFLFILSPAANESKWVQGEYHAFLTRKMREEALRIIPVLRKTCEIPPLISPLRYIDFRDFDHTDMANFKINDEGPFKELMDSIFRRNTKATLGRVHPALASYEFYFQTVRGKPKNPDGTLNHELAFKNITDSPLVNFEFTLRFKKPVMSVEYDFRRSSANMTGGDHLTAGGQKFNWRGNQIMENGGWVVFVVKSKSMPVISRLSTRLVGRYAGSDRIVSPDPDGI